ncbi:hypothetical protein GDO78_022041 [Eleutherodactylus coqui]|uniref:Uncharacterized protein n=1 Tax=Eleutherodactylus coqui TaxID=57060 RepID=A0A8J6JYL9_ELECQ|nr:hypothetical protein GDO78_022041 [Eleutherodactylus coqui]
MSSLTESDCNYHKTVCNSQDTTRDQWRKRRRAHGARDSTYSARDCKERKSVFGKWANFKKTFGQDRLLISGTES